MVRIQCLGKEDWLQKRRDYIGGSDAAAILDQSPFKSAAQLYDEKKGITKSKDISKNRAVAYGIQMEPMLRAQAQIDLPYFQWEYHAYDLLVSEERPYMAATLDGELTVIDDNPWDLPIGARGIYEAKTGSWRTEADLAEWDAFVPAHYVAQGLHQLSCTGWDFVIFDARIRRDGYRTEDQGFPDIRLYKRILDKRAGWVQRQMVRLEEAELQFWMDLKEGRRPARLIG